MFLPGNKPSLISLVALRERVKCEKDKAQAAGMAGASATLLECSEILSLLAKEQSFGLFRGKIVRLRENRPGFVNVRLRNVFVNPKGKTRCNRIDVSFGFGLVEQAKTLKIGDEIACDGKLQSGNFTTEIKAWHLEILKRGEQPNGNASS